MSAFETLFRLVELERGDRVVIVSDPRSDEEVARSAFSAALEFGGRRSLVVGAATRPKRRRTSRPCALLDRRLRPRPPDDQLVAEPLGRRYRGDGRRRARAQHARHHVGPDRARGSERRLRQGQAAHRPLRRTSRRRPVDLGVDSARHLVRGGARRLGARCRCSTAARFHAGAAGSATSRPAKRRSHRSREQPTAGSWSTSLRARRVRRSQG